MNLDTVEVTEFTRYWLRTAHDLPSARAGLADGVASGVDGGIVQVGTVGETFYIATLDGQVVQLPPAFGITYPITVRCDSSGCVILPFGDEQIEDNSEFELFIQESARLLSDGVKWRIV